MATLTYDQTTIDASQQRLAARELRRQRVRQSQQAKKRKAAVASNVTSSVNAAQIAARQAYTKGWQYVEEAVEDFALTFADLMLLSGPLVVLIYLTRLLVGNINRGGGTIGFRGFTVPRVPGYSMVEGIYRTAKVLLIGLISGAIYSAILLVGFVVTHPGLVFQIGLEIITNVIRGFFQALFGSPS